MVEIDLGDLKLERMPTPLDALSELPTLSEGVSTGLRSTIVPLAPSGVDVHDDRLEVLKRQKLRVVEEEASHFIYSDKLKKAVDIVSTLEGAVLSPKEAGELYTKITQETLSDVVDKLIVDKDGNLDEVKKEIESLGIGNRYKEPLKAYLFLTRISIEAKRIPSKFVERVYNFVREKRIPRVFDIESGFLGRAFLRARNKAHAFTDNVLITAAKKRVDLVLKPRVNLEGFTMVNLLEKGKTLKDAFEMSNQGSKAAELLESDLVDKAHNSLGGKERLAVLNSVVDSMGKFTDILLAVKANDEWLKNQGFLNSIMRLDGFFKDKMVSSANSDVSNLLKDIKGLDEFAIDKLVVAKEASALAAGNKQKQTVSGLEAFSILYRKLGKYEKYFTRTPDTLEYPNGKDSNITVVFKLPEDQNNPLPFYTSTVVPDPVVNPNGISRLDVWNDQRKDVEKITYSYSVDVNPITLELIENIEGFNFRSKENLDLIQELDQIVRNIQSEYRFAVGSFDALTLLPVGRIKGIEKSISENTSLMGLANIFTSYGNLEAAPLPAGYVQRDNAYIDLVNLINEYNESIPRIINTVDAYKIFAKSKNSKIDINGYLSAAFATPLVVGEALLTPTPDRNITKYLNQYFSFWELFTRSRARKSIGLMSALANTRIGIDAGKLRVAEISPGAILSVVAALAVVLSVQYSSELVESRRTRRVACLSVLPSQGLGSDSNLIGNDALELIRDYNALYNPFVEDMKTGEFKTDTQRFTEVLNVFGAPYINQAVYSSGEDMNKAYFKSLVATAFEAQRQSGQQADTLTIESRNKIEKLYKALTQDKETIMASLVKFYTDSEGIRPGLQSDGRDASGMIDLEKRKSIRIGKIGETVDEFLKIKASLDFQKAIDEATGNIKSDCQ